MQNFLVALLTAAALVDSEAFEKTKVAYDKARYEDVAKALSDADLTPLSQEQRSEARFMLGASQLALANDTLSQNAFTALYGEDPDFETPPYTAKKVLAALDRAKRQVPVQLDTSLRGDAVIVCGRGLSRKADVKIIFALPEGEEGGPAIPDGKCFRQGVPVSGRAIGYYVVAAVDGEVRATAGSRAQPLPIEKKAPPPVATVSTGTPWYKHWATWTIVGVVVAGAVAGGVVGGVVAGQSPGTLHTAFTFPTGAR